MKGFSANFVFTVVSVARFFNLLFTEFSLVPCVALKLTMFFRNVFSVMLCIIVLPGRALCHYAPGLTHWNSDRSERQGRAIVASIAAVRTFSLALVLSACHSR